MKFIYASWWALITSVGASRLRGTNHGGHGNDNATGNSRIVGGDDAGIGEYPFFVEWDACGAALVHDGEFHSNESALTFASILTFPNLSTFAANDEYSVLLRYHRIRSS
ncbi:hypothetical protein MHU86_5582 [Fragilaria crotonensis]|nr:hypothetical protein MHU86_5582 [Fragilaria crotonensis]